jgi:hypothetical protein
MSSAKLSTIGTRTIQCLAAAVLTASFAFGATPIASADDDGWEVQEYWKCLKKLAGPIHSGGIEGCCYWSDGVPIRDKNGTIVSCGAPAPLRSPTGPGGKPFTPLPQQGGEQGPGAPINPVPAGPDAGQR